MTSTVLSLSPRIVSEGMSATTGTTSVLTLTATIRRQFGITYFGRFLHSNLPVILWGVHTPGGVFGEHCQHLL